MNSTIELRHSKKSLRSRTPSTPTLLGVPRRLFFATAVVFPRLGVCLTPKTKAFTHAWVKSPRCDLPLENQRIERSIYEAAPANDPEPERRVS